MPLFPGIFASAISGHLTPADAGSYYPLGEFTLSAAQANVEFTNIPQTYTHLQIRGIVRGTEAVQTRVGFYVQFNSDTGTNYSRHNLIADGGGTAESNASTSQVSMFGASWMTPSALALSNVYAGFVCDVLDYRNTNKYKTGRMLIGFDNNGTTGSTGRVGLDSGVWMNTNAITSIKIIPTANNWAANSSFALYGVNA
jgi:hypothetical protein